MMTDESMANDRLIGEPDVCEMDAEQAKLAYRAWGRAQAKRANALEREIARCHARLEIDHAYRGEKMERYEIPMDERASFPDGISCRDETIKLLEERVESAERDLAAIEAELAKVDPNQLGAGPIAIRIKRLAQSYACAEENFRVTNQSYVRLDKELAAIRQAAGMPEEPERWCPDATTVQGMAECPADHSGAVYIWHRDYDALRARCLALAAARREGMEEAANNDAGRRDGHSALRVKDGQLERFDPHPASPTNATPQPSTAGNRTAPSQEDVGQGEAAGVAPDWLRRLVELEAKATKGPWYYGATSAYLWIGRNDLRPVAKLDRVGVEARGDVLQNAEFLVAYRNAFPQIVALAQAATQKPGWVSVKERLPEEHQAVLIFYPTGTDLFNRQRVAIYGHRGWRGGDESWLITPSHWMPLPAPPGAAEEKS